MNSIILCAIFLVLSLIGMRVVTILKVKDRKNIRTRGGPAQPYEVAYRRQNMFEWIMPILIAIAVLSLVIGLVSALEKYVCYPAELNEFMRQKEFIESANRDELAATGMLVHMSDLNRWLIRKQYLVRSFGDWSLYPKEVLNLEPIQ